MAEPSEAERALLSVYQTAERHLLEQSTRAVGKVVTASAADEAARRAEGARTVGNATGQIVGYLQGVVPGVLDTLLTAAAEQGTRAAVEQLRALGGGGDAYADEGVNRGALERLVVALLDRITEAHTAILRTVPDVFREVLGAVLPAGLVGVETRRQVAQRAWWQLTDRGVAGFTDRAGRTWRLSSYVEMASRTAMARATIDAQHDRLAAAGHTYVIVNGSGDRCERCRPWHGQVLSLNGTGARTVQVEHATIDGRMLDVHVAGSVLDARAAGWGHPQCRCSTSIYLPGVTRVPAASSAEDNGQYAARQRQRALERQIRAAKEREQAALDEPARREARQRVRAAEARMRAHLADNPDLLRRRYREQLGTGNVPDAARRAELAAERPVEVVRPDVAPAPEPAEVKARPVTKWRDAEIEQGMQDAIEAEDFDLLDELQAEMDKRDERKQARAERTAAEREARDEERAAEMERRMAAGDDEEEAIADVYGISVERQRRDRAIGQLRANGYTGNSFDELARAAYRDHVYEEMLRAERETNFVMWNHRGQAAVARAVARGAGSRPEVKLFTGTESYVRANASDELLEWFDRNGRPNFDAFRADWLGEGGQFRRGSAARGDYLT